MKIALLGDIALIGRYDRTLDPNVSSRISCVKEITKDCDFVIANLEAPFTSLTSSHMCKGVYLRSDPVNVETLREMGVTHVSLANNHIFDYGKIGAKETCKVLEQAGIRYVGLGYGPAVLSGGKEKVLLDGFCCLSANALGYGTKRGKVNLLTPETIETYLQEAEERHVLPIASVHFGVEGLHYPSVEHLRLFRELAEKHAYILHGNHPHAMQGVERVKDSLLIYAQGNLCFDEAKNTSIGGTCAEKDEERKNYIVIIEVSDQKIVDYKMIALTDLKTDILHADDSIKHELDHYCLMLQNPMSHILSEREKEKALQKESADERNISFFLKRLNYKYIGAFLNGKLHAKRYKQLFAEYM